MNKNRLVLLVVLLVGLFLSSCNKETGDSDTLSENTLITSTASSHVEQTDGATICEVEITETTEYIEQTEGENVLSYSDYSIVDGDYVLCPYLVDGEYVYVFAENGLSGMFEVYSIDAYNHDYLESINVGDVLSDVVDLYDSIIVDSIEKSSDESCYSVQMKFADSNDALYDKTVVSFIKQENGYYYAIDEWGYASITCIAVMELSISEDVVIYDNAEVFGCHVPTFYYDESITNYLNNINDFVNVLNSDDCWGYPTLFVRITDGVINLICINPFGEQPWRDYPDSK